MISIITVINGTWPRLESVLSMRLMRGTATMKGQTGRARRESWISPTSFAHGPAASARYNALYGNQGAIHID